jgi:hypothetical protein
MACSLVVKDRRNDMVSLGSEKVFLINGSAWKIVISLRAETKISGVKDFEGKKGGFGTSKTTTWANE